jgi:acyl-CoA thioester hydrolase
MSKFRFHYPITVRYGDLDPQWHVNNSKIQAFIETARLYYLLELGLFDGNSFDKLPFIVGDVHIRYLIPILPTDEVLVSMGITRIGTKSVFMEYEVTSGDSSQLFAAAETIMVAYDYHLKSSVPVSAELRKIIGEYEGRTF